MASVGIDFLIFALASLSATILGLIIIMWNASRHQATHQMVDTVMHPPSAKSFLQRLLTLRRTG